MSEQIKRILRRTPVYQLWCVRRERLEIRAWEAAGRPLPPPPALKQRNIRRAAKTDKLRVLVETGTFSGQMVEAMRKRFDRIYSIELSCEYHEAAKKRFSAYPHIELILGDSGDILRGIVEGLDRPALFWLDGHYSGGMTARGSSDTPIMEELKCIYPNRLGHVAIVDDARLFGEDPAYPSIAEIKELVLSRDSKLEIDVVDDAIRITPAR